MSYERPSFEELVKEELERMMSDLSENCYCARWIRDNEYALWARCSVETETLGGVRFPTEP